MERGSADAEHADKPDQAECQPNHTVALLNRGKDGKGGNGYADAAEHVPDFVSLMALQAAFLRPQRCHITVIRTPPSRNKLKPLGLSRIEVEQGTRFPLVGAVLRAFGGQAANMEVHRLGLEAFRDLPGHIGWIEPDKPPPVRGEERALIFGKPRVGLAIGLFGGPDAAPVGIPAACIHDAGKEGPGLDLRQLCGIFIFTLHGPLKKREEQKAPEQAQQERKSQHMPA